MSLSVLVQHLVKELQAAAYKVDEVTKKGIPAKEVVLSENVQKILSAQADLSA